MDKIEAFIKYLRSLPRIANKVAIHLLFWNVDEHTRLYAEWSIINEFGANKIDAPLWLDLISNITNFEKMNSLIDEATAAMICQALSMEVQP